MQSLLINGMTFDKVQRGWGQYSRRTHRMDQCSLSVKCHITGTVPWHQVTRGFYKIKLSPTMPSQRLACKLARTLNTKVKAGMTVLS